MNRKDLIYESYEDALFALLMDEVADKEGELLLKENEQLNLDPGAALPDELDRKCRRTIKRAFSVQSRRNAARAIGRAMSKAAVIALVVVLLFSTAYALVPEIRVRTLNLLIEKSSVAASLTFYGATQAARQA